MIRMEVFSVTGVREVAKYSYHLPRNASIFQELGNSLPLQRIAADIGRVTTRGFVVVDSDTSFIKGLRTTWYIDRSTAPKGCPRA